MYVYIFTCIHIHSYMHGIGASKYHGVLYIYIHQVISDGGNGSRCVINIACMYVCIKSSVMAFLGCSGSRCVKKDYSLSLSLFTYTTIS